MNHEEAGRLWDGNADAWTQLARAGYDIYRDHLNSPAFFELLPEVTGLSGLDIGCGEGHNTRLLARRGARITGVDIAANFISHASQAEADEPLGINYRIASAVELPFADQSFDFATGFMSFMDVPETDRVLAEAFRVLKSGDFSSSRSAIRASTPRIVRTCATRAERPTRSRSAITSATSRATWTNGCSVPRPPRRRRDFRSSGRPGSRGRSASG